jgi:hypothetical protein
MSSAVCTLFEGHYHLGAAALINSLWASGFRGRVVCGYRGTPPPWAEPARSEANDVRVRDFGEGFEVWLVPCATRIHFTNYKPGFLLESWEGAAGNPDKYYYLDPDIVLKCPWEVMERWAHEGIGCCEDVNFYLPPRHPLRIGWTEWLKKHGILVVNPSLQRYYSGGFVGIPRDNKDFLRNWQHLIEKVGEASGSLTALKQGTANSLFHSMDQDAMNMAFMVTDVKINATGPEGMDFAPGGHLLSHAIGSRKPWKGGFVKQALTGYPPSMANKSFFNYIDGPIQLFTPSQKFWLSSNLKLGSMIGRFYRRS